MLAAVSPASYISYAFSCLEALHNTYVASPTVPSRLSLNYHPFRQEVSIQASWAYISVTSNVRGLSSVFQEYDLRSPLLKKRPDSIKLASRAWLHDRHCQGLLHTQIMLVRIKEQKGLHAASSTSDQGAACCIQHIQRTKINAHPARAIACLLQ